MKMDQVMARQKTEMDKIEARNKKALMRHIKSERRLPAILKNLRKSSTLKLLAVFEKKHCRYL